MNVAINNPNTKPINLSRAFQAGGALSANHPSYVTRPADDKLLKLALAGDFAYVLTPRQMGKTSLVHKTIKRLEENNVRSLKLDLTAIGQVDVERWYNGLIFEISKKLKLDINLEDWWARHNKLGPVQRFSYFLEDVLLSEITEPIVIFIDEIDKTLTLGFSDDFFAVIRALYNNRPANPALKRLSFILMGVASPTDLIIDPTQTPFNIGTPVSLQDFTLETAKPLQAILEQAYPHQAPAILDHIFYWTDGHPYLTQRVCQAVLQAPPQAWSKESITPLIDSIFIAQEIESDSHLKTIQDKLITRAYEQPLLKLYRAIYQGQKIKDNPQSLLHNTLKLSGLVKTNANGYLQVRNKLYKEIFNLAWIDKYSTPETPKTPDVVLQKIKACQQTQNPTLDLSLSSLTHIPPEVFSLTHLKELNLFNNRLNNLPSKIGQLKNLTLLDLRGNNLTNLPPEIGQLKSLTSLKLGWNNLNKFPLEIGQLKNLTELDLSVNGLSHLPVEIGQLKNLVKLKLGANFPDQSLEPKSKNNCLSSLPVEIGQLQTLAELNLSYNNLSSLPIEIGQLKSLTALDLSANNLDSLPIEIVELTSLTTLILMNNNLDSLPTKITLLKNLTSLLLMNNNFSNFPLEINQLKNLTHLLLSNNKLNKLPPEISQLKNLTVFDLGGNNLHNLPPEIGQLKNLTLLDLGGNNLHNLPPEIGQLQSLNTLNLGILPEMIVGTKLKKNKLTDFPLGIIHLKNLTSLDLSFNNLSNLPPEIGQLQNLTTLNLDKNNLSNLPPEIGQLQNLRNLYLKDNPIQTPPLETLDLQGDFGKANLEKIRAYFRQQTEQGLDYLYEAKLLIVGEGGTGKTTLARKIEDANYKLTDESSTENIEVKQWTFKIPEEIQGEALSKIPDTFTLNLWDFGGQAIYHATHQFFLTKRSLYVLVLDDRREDTDLHYWLEIIALLSNNSPTLIIKNEKQDRERDIGGRKLQDDFPNIKAIFRTNLATNRGLSEIIEAIKEHSLTLPHIGDALPKTWVKVRLALENETQPYISIKDYFKICQANGFTRQDNMLQLSQYLHDLGVCLHFQDDIILKRRVILKPDWVTTAVYRVLDNKQVIANLGRFSEADLSQIWHEESYQAMLPELLQLMKRFKLCYPLKNSLDYIAPQLLSPEQPIYPWPQGKHTLRLHYQYQFMPKGIINQFIVATHDLIANQDYVWRGGVILAKEKTQAEVIEYQRDRRLTVQVVGTHKRNLLSIIRHELELIHRSFPGLRYQELIPCQCNTCNTSQTPYYFPLNVLQKARQAGQRQIQCYNSFEMINIRQLMDDVFGSVSSFKQDDDLLYQHQRRLQRLKEKAAHLGINTPSEILIEIEDIEAKIERLTLLTDTL